MADWTPPPEMIQRQPYLPVLRRRAGKSDGAESNLGKHRLPYARHQMSSGDIGQAVSSGCFPFVNDEITDLFARDAGRDEVIIRSRRFSSCRADP